MFLFMRNFLHISDDYSIKIIIFTYRKKQKNENMNNKRYIIRKVDSQHMYTYYTGGAGQHSCQAFDENINVAKIFKNVAGAKVACGDIYCTHHFHELEIIEVALFVTSTEPIKYEHPSVNHK